MYIHTIGKTIVKKYKMHGDLPLKKGTMVSA